MWIAVLIILLAIAMMLGPIMLIQPSKRQRRLAQLRTAAISHGLRVRMAPLPPKSARAGETVAVYYRAWPEGRKRREPWLLARQSFSHGVHFAGDWDWADEREAPLQWQDALKHQIAGLPGSVVAIEATRETLGLYWLEHAAGLDSKEATAQVAEWLDHLVESEP